MIPSDIVEIDQIPLTGNGKIDRNILVLKHKTHIISDFSEETIISDRKENLLAGIWAELLKKEELKLDIRDILNYPVLKFQAKRLKSLTFQEIPHMKKVI